MISDTICAISKSALPLALTTRASISCLTVAVRMPDAAEGCALGCWSRPASSLAMDASLLINFCARCCLALLSVYSHPLSHAGGRSCSPRQPAGREQPTAGEGELQMQLVNPTHEGEDRAHRRSTPR